MSPILRRPSMAPFSNRARSSILARFLGSAHAVSVGDQTRGAREDGVHDPELVGPERASGLGDVDDRAHAREGGLDLGRAPRVLDLDVHARGVEKRARRAHELGRGRDGALEVPELPDRAVLGNRDDPRRGVRGGLGVPQLRDLDDVAVVLDDPVVAADADVDDAVLHVQRDLLRAKQHHRQVLVRTRGEVVAVLHLHRHARAREELLGGFLERALRRTSAERNAGTALFVPEEVRSTGVTTGAQAALEAEEEEEEEGGVGGGRSPSRGRPRARAKSARGGGARLRGRATRRAERRRGGGGKERQTMMAETIRCKIPPPLEIVAARRGGGSRETGEAHPRGIVRADAASAAVEAEDMVPMGSASGVVTGRCALVDARAPIAVDPTVAFFPRGAVRRTRSGSRTKKRTRKNPETDPFWDRARSFQRHLSNVLFPPVTDRRLGRCVRCRRNRPLPTTKTGAHEARGKKERHRDRGAVERRARTPLRARHGRRSPRVRHSRSPACVPSPRSCSRSSPAPREAAEPRATTAVERRRHRGVCWVHGFFKPRRGAARARGRDGRALGS